MESKSQELKTRIRELTTEKQAYLGKVQKQQFEKDRNVSKIQKGRKTVAELEIEVLKVTEVKEKYEKDLEQRKKKNMDNYQKFKDENAQYPVSRKSTNRPHRGAKRHRD